MLRAVAAGEPVAIIHYRREVAHVVPVGVRLPVTAKQAESIFRLSPLPDDSWSRELAESRAEAWDDPWDHG